MTKPIEDSANAAAIRTALDVPTNAALTAKYTKPTNGIPATDLDADPAGRLLLTTTSASERKQVLGLDQVNNTSDANKPVSTAQAEALATKMNATMPALQSVFDGGTAAQKAAFQASVSADGKYCVFAQIGDSRQAFANVSSAGSYGRGGMAPLNFLRALMRQAFSAPQSLVFAVSGTDSEHLLNVQVPQVLASIATDVSIICSTNDRGINGWPASRTITALNSAVSQLIASGRRVWIWNELPRGDASVPSNRLPLDQLGHHMTVRRWISGLPKKYGARAIVLDAWDLFADGTVTTGDSKWQHLPDALHQGIGAGLLMALRALPEFQARIPSQPRVACLACDSYNADTNPGGSIFTNPGLTGSGGTAVAPCTGSVATGASLSVNTALAGATGLSVVASKVSTSTGEWQQIVASGTASSTTGAALTFEAAPGVFAINAGDKIVSNAQIEVDSGATGVVSVVLMMRRAHSGGTEFYSDLGAGISAPGLWPSNVGVSLEPETMDFTAGISRTTGAAVTESQLATRVIVTFRESIAFSVTLRIRNIGPRKLQN